MSKSLGNIYTTRDIEAKGFNPLAFRYLILTSHYRSKLNFTWDSLEAAQNSLERLYDFIRVLRGYRSPTSIVHRRSRTSEYHRDFQAAVSNDLDTPRALAVLWQLIHAYNKNPSGHDPKDVLSIFYEFDKVLGLGLKKIKPERTPAKIQQLAAKREEYRRAKQWAEADKIRTKILSLGYQVEDTTTPPLIKKTH